MRSSTVRAGALALACALVAVGLVAQAAQAGCITRLPVNVSLPDGPYAERYRSFVRVQVRPRGVRIRNLRAELYTFTGRRMGVSARRRAVRNQGTLKIHLTRTFRPLQVGGFTLVLTGEPNASSSCGPKQSYRVLKFRDCQTKLPISFPNLPGGRAADYGPFLSVPVRSDGSVIADVRSEVYSAAGALIGRSSLLPALFGQRTMDHPLARPLAPGVYTVIVKGLIRDQPSSCGPKSAQATMTFT